jgi:murein L,D-transpeptidase YcbB/YkuD
MPSAKYGSDWHTLNCVMARGAKSSAVWVLQQNLNHCYQSGLAEDGDFGPATRAAVVNVQRKYGISADGIYGPKTRDVMTWYTSAGCLRFHNPWPTTYGG